MSAATATAHTWDGATGGVNLHAADWETGRALCGAYVVPVSTTGNPDDWRPRCKRCTAKAATMSAPDAAPRARGAGALGGVPVRSRR